MKKSTMSKDYKEYLSQQVTRAENKWARKGYYDDLFKRRLQRDWEKIRDLLPAKPRKIICMGCRDGTELFEFKSYYSGAMVTGIDITENIKSIRTSKMRGVDVRVQDFSKLPEDWTDLFDVVFSNSLDHAFDPYQTIKEWHRVSKGHLFIQLALDNKPNRIEHCFEESDIEDLFPSDLFELQKVWKSETLNVLAKVKDAAP